MISIFPVFEKADWNNFGRGSGWVKVPLKAYEHEASPFEVEVGDTCIIIENEEMMGCFATVLELHTKRDKNGTPKYVKVRVD